MSFKQRNRSQAFPHRAASPPICPSSSAENFKLAVNLKTAKALLTVPLAIMLRADDVIE
jgi:hypothetical protein